ncbi:MAG: hypothetical protein EOP48_08640 [Sphingobacteriales bacterium]|nr:MAG: hypothetical protein EOP48_08640 [Sphingobacteriales bacterium]
MTKQEITIIEGVLSLTDATGKIVKQYLPFFEIAEFRRIRPDVIIVREKTRSQIPSSSNIYRLNEQLEIVWFAEPPFDDDSFPNPIIWNKEIEQSADTWASGMIDNTETFTCSSAKGMTISINYLTGQIIKSVFTK